MPPTHKNTHIEIKVNEGVEHVDGSVVITCQVRTPDVDSVCMLHSHGERDELATLCATLRTELVLLGSYFSSHKVGAQAPSLFSTTITRVVRDHCSRGPVRVFSSFCGTKAGNTVSCAHIGSIRYCVISRNNIVTISKEHNLWNDQRSMYQTSVPITEIEAILRHNLSRCIGLGTETTYDEQQFGAESVDCVIVFNELVHQHRDIIDLDELQRALLQPAESIFKWIPHPHE